MSSTESSPPRPRSRGTGERLLGAIPHWALYVLGAYLCSRLLYFGVAVGATQIHHVPLHVALANWDGKWYVLAAEHGYPHTIPQHKGDYSTLGFLPAYPLLIWLLTQLPWFDPVGAGVLISLVCGAVATLAISRLAARWWGEPASRVAIWFFCLFPGTIVFSMVYSEGVELAAVALALLALEDRRWFAAGAGGAVATATAATGLAIIPAALAAVYQQARRHGWRDRRARLALWAPALSLLGIAAFGIFLWHWTGTPMASYTAQNRAWEESSTPLAIPNLFGRVIGELFLGKSVGPVSAGPSGDDLNAIHGLIGFAILLWGCALLWRDRHRVHLTALVWTAVVALLTLTSPKTPPNARMLICAFPVLLAIAVSVKQPRWRRLLFTVELIALIGMSYLTFYGHWLRP